jgi:hypothetical protein
MSPSNLSSTITKVKLTLNVSLNPRCWSRTICNDIDDDTIKGFRLCFCSISSVALSNQTYLCCFTSNSGANDLAHARRHFDRLRRNNSVVAIVVKKSIFRLLVEKKMTATSCANSAGDMYIYISRGGKSI